MSASTEIQWADSTFNPWIGCTKVGPGCDHCYAERDFDHRRHVVSWGAGQARKRTRPANWQLPVRWNAQPFYECMPCGWRGEHPQHPADGGLWTCPACGDIAVIVARRRVFCASLADVFDNEVDIAWLIDLFELIRNTPNLDWLLLTKRIGRVIGALEAARAQLDHETPVAYPLPVRHWVHNWMLGDAPSNVWLSTLDSLYAESEAHGVDFSHAIERLSAALEPFGDKP